MATRRPRPARVNYPTTDGKPVAETQCHLFLLIDLIGALRARYDSNPRVWVSAQQLLYYVEGKPRRRIAPDVMVTFGIPTEPPRLNYQVWREGKAPDVMIELTSLASRRKDTVVKFALYRDVLRVREYFLFDPLEDYLKPPLKGYRLVKGDYLPIAEVNGRLPSKLLDLHLERDGSQLRLYDPKTGSRLLTAMEAREALKQSIAEREKIEATTRGLQRETRRLCLETRKLERQTRTLHLKAAALREQLPCQP
jgi:Uma2 family endonuclease